MFTLGYLGETAQLTSLALAGTTLATTWSYLPNSGDRRLSGIASTGLVSSETSSFTYTSNDLGWITSSTESSDAPTVYPSSAQQTGVANSLNQITVRNGQNLTYDADGHLLSDGQRTYSWDAAGRLIGVLYPGQPGESTSFIYDGLGRRVVIADTAGGGTTTMDYVWCGLSLCQTRNPDGSVAREYLAEGEYSPGSPATTAYDVRDPVGTVRRVFVSGTSAPAYAYDPYGQPPQATAPVTGFTYAGMFHEAASGLDLTLARAYDPQAGRWLTRDPLGEATDPYGNLYAYVGGDPVSLNDPSGLIAKPFGPDGPFPAPTPAGGGTGAGSGNCQSNPPPLLPNVSGPDNPIQNVASTTNPNYAAKMLGYDRNTFGDILHQFKPFYGLSPSDNVTFHGNGDVYFQGNLVGNIHDFAP